MKRLLIPIITAIILSGCQTVPAETNDNLGISPINNSITNTMTPTPQATATPQATTSSIFATINTTQGKIKIELFASQAPKTVANFIGLATGEIEWLDPKTSQKKSNTPLYNGTIFHRVIKDFMIQGGDPLGLGIGGPGYKFADEFDPNLNFDEPYILAMANSGPNTNGSQFFITVVPTPWLNQKHTIFGKVVEGQKVVDAIANTKTGSQDKPITDIKISKIDITDK